ncbi:MAG: glycosyltransferase family 9 protein [Chlamydiales bacterium]|nr:glycosyltransferase family 9 protein [Chlamydiales bacterium]
MQILIVKMSSLGDIMQSFFALQYLKNRFPTASIDIVVDKRWIEIARASPDINGIIAINTKQLKQEIIPFVRKLRCKKYDVVFDLQGNCKALLGTFFASSKKKIGFAWSQLAEWPNGLGTYHKIKVDTSLSMHLQYLEVIKKYYQDKAIFSLTQILLKVSADEQHNLDQLKHVSYKSTFLVGFASKWNNKQLKDDVLVDVLVQLESQLGVCFVLLYQGEEESIRASDMVTKLKKGQSVGNRTLPVVQQLMLQAKGFIGVDSSLLHLAFLTQIPTFSIFGPSSSQVYGINSKSNASFQGACPFGQTFHKRCNYLRSCILAPCVKSVSAEHLADQIKRWMISLSA